MRRPIVMFAAVAGAVMLLMAGSNWLVDPLDQVDGPRIPGFNEKKTETFKYDRLSRQAEISRLGPDCLLLGSSRVAVGFDASDPALAGCDRPYNAGLAGATLQEVTQLLELAGDDPPPKLVVISLDLFMFNATRAPRSNDLSTHGLLDKTRYLFDTSTFLAAVDTVRNQDGDTPLEPDGDVSDTAFGRTLEYMGNHRALFLRGLQGYIGHNLPPPNYDFAYQSGDRDALISLRHILEWRYRAPGTRTVIVFSPAHAWQWQLLRTIGLEPQWRDFKRRTVVLVEDLANAGGQQPFAVYDFAGFEPVQTEPVPALEDEGARVQGYWDASHFRKVIGSRVLAVIGDPDSAGDPSLGARVDVRSLDSRLAVIDEAASAWRAANPETVEEINSLVACYAPATLARRLRLVRPHESICRDFRLITR